MVFVRGDLCSSFRVPARRCTPLFADAVDVARALGARKGIRRWGTAMCPLDESLSRAVVDISSRPHADIQLQFTR